MEKARLPGISEGNDLAGNLGGHRRGFAQHLGGEVDVEAGPSGRGADLVHHDRDEVGRAGFEQIGGMQKLLAALVRAERGPGGEGLGRGFGGGDSIVGSGGGGARGDFAGDWVLPDKSGCADGSGVAIADEKLYFGHGRLLFVISIFLLLRFFAEVVVLG